VKKSAIGLILFGTNVRKCPKAKPQVSEIEKSYKGGNFLALIG